MPRMMSLTIPCHVSHMRADCSSVLTVVVLPLVPLCRGDAGHSEVRLLS